jgi:hypothetical protein
MVEETENMGGGEPPTSHTQKWITLWLVQSIRHQDATWDVELVQTVQQQHVNFICICILYDLVIIVVEDEQHLAINISSTLL